MPKELTPVKRSLFAMALLLSASGARNEIVAFQTAC